MTDKVFDVEVASISESGDIACDGGITANSATVTGSITTGTLNVLDVNCTDSLGASNIFSCTAPIVVMNNLPTADPHIDGRVWNNSMVLTVSQG